MKYVLALMLIVGFNYCGGQKTSAEKFSHDGKDSFVIVYDYDEENYMSPSVGRMICDSNMQNCVEDTAAYRRDRHYYAIINVFKLTKRGRLLIGEKTYGYYTINGCFEDIPEVWVQHAKDLQAVIDKNIELQKLNGKNAVYKYIVTWEDFKIKYVNAEYGVDIKRLHHKKEFKTNPEAHKFIDEKLLAPIIGGGVNIKMDSILINRKK